MDSQGKHFDMMSNTPVSKLIIRLSIPTIISMMATTIYNMVDTAFVGKLGNSASGAVGIVFGFMSILQAIGFMFGQGSGSLLSRALGARDKEEASVVASTGFFASFGLGIAAAVICAIFVDPLVMFLGSTETIAPYAKTYIYYILATAPLVVTSFTLNNILRYEGKALLGMIGLISGGVLNIIGDAIFMFGFDMGIAGAGLSTAISQVISFCILISMFVAGKTECRISIKRVSFKNLRLLNIITTGFPSLIRQSLGSIGTILLNYEAAYYAGDAAVAAMSIVSRVSFFLFAIALGIGQGFQPVCGFSYGAKKFKRLREAYRFTTIMATSVLFVLTVLALCVSSNIVKVFRDDAQVIEIGTRALRLVAVAQVFLPICMVTEMMMQSSGWKKAATLLSSLRGGLVFIPALLVLSYFRGLSGIQEAQPLSYILTVPPAILYARKFFRSIPKDNASSESTS